uniref:Guanylate cyclase domain-containing protein n=1 Tax=Zooxanthella nutricula TaxID=1333877 RepID=A0A7S2PDC0_9DINO
MHGRMIASSSGIHQVIGYTDDGRPVDSQGHAADGRSMQQGTAPDGDHRNRQPEQFTWNTTGDPVIEQSASFLSDYTGNFQKLVSTEKALVVQDTNANYVYSALAFRSGGPSRAIEWVIINAQPISWYKERVQAAVEAGLEENQEELSKAVIHTATLTGVFVVLGISCMACAARAVTRPLVKIEQDMRAVRNFEHDFLNQIGENTSRYGRGNIRVREVADICDSFVYMAIGLQSFSRYMDPHLVQTLVRQRNRAVLGMAKAEVTVFFSDIAGFTTMAESLDPEVLMDMLGTYLEDMSDIVMKHGGVVGEFVGDEIMAWWNAPPLQFKEGEHTVAALTAALEQQEQLASLRRRWCARGLPAMTARMGIVRGQVLAGNLGSKQRMKYGLVGDNVNLASRLEGLCKMYGVGCLVDDAVYNAAGVAEAFALRPVDLVAVKGRSGATEIFELVARRPEGWPLAAASKQDLAEAAFCADFAAAQALYRRGDFAAAGAALEAFLALWPGDRPATLLRGRCEELAKMPKDELEAWTPLVQMTEK